MKKYLIAGSVAMTLIGMTNVQAQDLTMSLEGSVPVACSLNASQSINLQDLSGGAIVKSISNSVSCNATTNWTVKSTKGGLSTSQHTGSQFGTLIPYDVNLKIGTNNMGFTGLAAGVDVTYQDGTGQPQDIEPFMGKPIELTVSPTIPVNEDSFIGADDYTDTLTITVSFPS